jgi:hypothetical protein
MGDFCGQFYFSVRSNSIAELTSSGEDRLGKRRSANLSSSFLIWSVFSFSFVIFIPPPVFDYNLSHQTFSVNTKLHFLPKIVRLNVTKKRRFYQKKRAKTKNTANLCEFAQKKPQYFALRFLHFFIKHSLELS